MLPPNTHDWRPSLGTGIRRRIYNIFLKNTKKKKKYSGTIKISTVYLKNKYSEWQGNNYKNNKVAMQDL